VFSIVIENVYSEIAQKITREVSVPTICIGAGPFCDGQILVINDLLGLGEFTPYFAKKYLDLNSEILGAVNNFIKDVKSNNFPSKEYYRSLDS
jgi:3-methyl-2-oxobutanoate hydroxymethyltransferase